MVTFGAVKERAEGACSREVNIGRNERIVSGVLGGLMAAGAISRPSLPRLLLGVLGGGLVYRALSGHCPMYEKLGINNAMPGAATPHDYYKNGIHVEMAYTVMRPAGELYEFWRNFENLPRFMKHLEAVTRTGEKTSHWIAAAPAGRSVSWDAEIINEEPGHLIAWRSLEHSDVHIAGSVWFTPRDERRTEVRVSLEYIPPAGKIGQAIAFLFGKEPRQQIQEDLRAFKRMAESGEILATQPPGTF